jgi:uncharacterized protein (TIGR02246 family)
MLLAVSLIAWAGSAQAGDTTKGADLKAQVEAGNAAWVTGVNKHDAAGLAALYTENATMLPPDADILRGRPAIQKYIQDGLDAGFSNLSLTTVDLTRLGPTTAREIGRYSYDLRNAQKQLVKVAGKYVIVWRLVKGKWMFDSDIWNVTE